MASKDTPSGTLADGIIIRPATHDDIDALQEVEMLARSTFIEHNQNLQEIAEQGPYSKSGHQWAIDHAITFVALMNISTTSTDDDRPQDIHMEGDHDSDDDDDEDANDEDEDSEPGYSRMEISTRARSLRYDLRDRRDETNKRPRSPSPEHGSNKKRNKMSRLSNQLHSGPSMGLKRAMLSESSGNDFDLTERVEMGYKRNNYGDRPHKNPRGHLKSVTSASPTTLRFSRLSVARSPAMDSLPMREDDEFSSGSSSPLSILDTKAMEDLEIEVFAGMGMAFSRQEPSVPCSGAPCAEGLHTQTPGMDIQTPQVQRTPASIPDDTTTNARETIVGFLTAVPMKSRNDGTVIHIELLMVGKDHQQKGVGGTLLRTLINIVDSDIPEPFESTLSMTQRRRLAKWRRKRLSLLTYDVPWGTQFYERNGFQKVPHACNVAPGDMPKKLKNNLDFHHLNTLAADARPAGSDTVPESALWCLVRNWRGR